MKTSPRVVPLFRSDGQAVVLSAIFLSPTGLSLADIARRSGLSPAAVHHEVERLEQAGLVGSERIGRTRVVRPDESSPVYRELSGLVAKTLGPLAILSRELAEVPGRMLAFIFGSWARRYRGDPGRLANDVDVVVIGAENAEDVLAACRRAEDQLRMEVNPVLVTADEWEEGATPFLENIKDGPLVPLVREDA